MSDRIKIIDTHAHVLFGMDDGARTIEESVSLIDEEIKQGVIAIIATPHYSRKSESADIRLKQEKCIAEIQARMGKRDFRIYSGNETIWHEDMPGRIKDGHGLTLAGSRYVLVEYDESVDFDQIARSIRTIENYGYIPIIAHAERYICLRDGNRIDEVIRMQAKLQMNYDSLVGGVFNRDVRWCRRLVTERKIHLLGTDMHRVDWRRPEIEKSMEWLTKNLSDKAIERMTYVNPMHIIHNESLG